jgi:O-antigen/teichoic acid export membrane protein
MSSFSRNVLTSAAERAVTAVLTLVIVPFQVRLLGMEAYGLLSFVTSLQVLFNILDFGLAPTIVREIAGDHDPARSHSATVVQTFSAVYWTIAGVLGVGLFASSAWLAKHWLHFDALPVDTVVLAIRLMAVSILLRWPVSLYAGSITGIQRLDVVNMIRVAASVVRLLGGLLVLLASRSLVAYLLWLGLVALLEVVSYVVALTTLMPVLSLRPRLSFTMIRKLWRYSIHMNVISLLAMVLVQSDRLIISRFLSVTELGYYSLAYNIVAGLSVIPTVLTTALFPQLARDMSLDQTDHVRSRCDIAVQLVLYAVTGAACVLIFFGSDILGWIAPNSASRAYLPMVLLTVGFVLAAAVSVPYTLSVASGQTRVPLLVNVAAVVVYVPALFVLVRLWGIAGAAFAMAALNCYYLFVMVPLMQRRIPMRSAPAWFLRNVLPFLVAGPLLIGGAEAMVHERTLLHVISAAAGGCVLYGVVAAFFIDSSVRRYLREWATGAQLREAIP